MLIVLMVSSRKGKVQQVVWVDAAAMVTIMQKAREFNLAPNVIITEILDIAANNEEVIRQLDEKLKPPELKRILYPCQLCGKQFLSSHELIKHLYSHIQTKQ